MGINLRLWFIQAKLRQMEKYLELCNSAFVQKSDEIVKSFDKYIKTSDLLNEEIDYDQFTDELIEIEKVFPKQLFSSFVISWYAFVEQELLDFCEICELKIEISAKDNIRFKKGIDRAKEFLDEAANYQIEQEDWQQLDQIRTLRNFLVHKGTEINCSTLPIDKPNSCKILDKDEVSLYFEMQDCLLSYLQKYNLIETVGITLLVIPTMEYCKGLIDFGLQFFKKLYTSDFYLHQ